MTSRRQATHGCGVELLEARCLLSSISGVAFVDANTNGVRDAGENTFATTRSFYLDLNNSGLLDAGEPSSGVDATGRFLFDNLSPGNYQVRGVPKVQTGPALYGQTLPGNYAGRTINLADNEQVTDADFGYSSDVGMIASGVFRDLNGDGVHQGGDFNLYNALVYADLNNDATRQPDEPIVYRETPGNRYVDGLLPGTYTFRLLVPQDYHQTAPANNGGITISP